MSTEQKVRVEFDKILRVSEKMMNLLSRRTKNPSEAYLVSKFLTIYFEKVFGLKMQASDEKELNDLVKKMLDEINSVKK